MSEHLDRLLAYGRLVRSMREAQKAYFKGRSPEVLAQSKSLERQVDRETTLVLEFTTPTLFDLQPAGGGMTNADSLR